MIALVMAIAGTAIAGSGSQQKITKGKVKAIATKQINSLAPGLNVKSAKTAGSATTATTANSAKIATNFLSANVAADGTMIGSVPDGATSSKNATGDYRVNLGRDVTGCTLAASASSVNSGPSLGFVAVGVINGTTLQVFTRNTTNVVVDRPFNVQAICPAQ
jgi:hypothetical protein